MKQIITILFSLIQSIIIFGQETDFDLNKIEFKGLKFSVSKKMIVEKFGKPKINEPDYECGFHSNGQYGGPFYQLVYSNFVYIGSDKGDFLLEHVDFDGEGLIRVKYGNIEISGLTTIQEFDKLFGKYVDEQFNKDSENDEILIFSKNSDVGVIFTFVKGKLKRFEYYSPC